MNRQSLIHKALTGAGMMLSLLILSACGGDVGNDGPLAVAECYSGGSDCPGDELCLRNNTCRKIEGFGSMITVTSGSFAEAGSYYVEVQYRGQTELIKTQVSASTTSPSWHESEFFMLRGASDWWTITVKEEGFISDSTVLECEWELDVAEFELSSSSRPFTCSGGGGEVEFTHTRGDD